MRRPYPAHAYGDAPRAACYWPTTIDAPVWSPLDGPAQADVAIIGGGFTGLSAALHLVEQGVSVALVDARQPGWGASGRNGGFCCLGGAMLPHAQMDRQFGDGAGRDWAATERDAVATVDALVTRLSLDIDRHSRGETMLAHSPRAWDETRRHAEEVAALHDITPELIPPDAMHAAGMAGPFHGALTVPIGFGLNPLKYLTGLARAATSAGARLSGDTPATGITRQSGGWRVTTPRGEITADQVIVATNGYSSDDLPDWLRGRFLPAQSAVLVTDPIPDDIATEQGWTSGQMAYTTRTFLHYLRRMPCGRMLFGMRGSLLSSTRADARAEARLRRHFAALFPRFAQLPARHVWSGLVSLSARMAPFCGPVPDQPGLWAALNYHGNGVAMGSHCGAILADMVTGGRTDRAHAAFLSQPPPRFPGGRFRRHLLWPAYGWTMLTDR
ncbi:NAD(P)/FAD-dependent oxidoreductase [Pseudaestuariivita atlantica]|uniref:FAD-dependent oxidoreductase n=1 Tax=Pseudaestuariivita atlantica TaxID=1317121 RepID=A0A0L1JPD8_9RHOB|nr:FAD-binding oxidoreductase [Pseudaestuariivita atlantica]KNG93577.1 FAD-dependent oxidoreductase [Pseudaestuariivita atlantica]